MPTLVHVAALADFLPGSRRAVTVADREITVVRVGDRFAAVWNRCPHSNGRLMDGVVDGDEVTCPLHRWKFDLFTGATARDRRMLATTYRVVVEGGEVFVEA